MLRAEAIQYLAASEGRRLRPLRPLQQQGDLDHEHDVKLPFFELRRSARALHGHTPLHGGGSSIYAVTYDGHQGHDNEGRLPFMCQWLADRVLPLVDPEVDVSGCYRIELHDSYSYLPRSGRYDNALTFARPVDACASRQGMALMPDPYHVAGFGGVLDVPDTVPWSAKSASLFFAGATTGCRDPLRNERIRACVWALGQAPGLARMHITNIVQMDQAALFKAVPELPRIVGRHVPVSDHFKHRYQVNIAGNTACWSRLPMVLNSKCLAVHLQHPDMMWYYPLLQAGEHMLMAHCLDDLARMRNYAEANPEDCRRMVANANAFASDVLRSPVTADTYMALLLEAAALANKP